MDHSFNVIVGLQFQITPYVHFNKNQYNEILTRKKLHYSVRGLMLQKRVRLFNEYIEKYASK